MKSALNNKPQPLFTARMAHLGFLILTLMLILSPRQVHAQVLYGTLNGNITDSSGAAVAGAQVQARDSATNVITKTVTDNSGRYQFLALPPDSYELTVKAASFQTNIVRGIVIAANNAQRTNVKVEPAQLSQVVTVTDAPPQLETERASVSSELESQQLEDLPAGPNAGMRNFQSVFTIVPGFTPPRASHSESGNPGDTLATNVNGNSASNNNTKIDGVSDIAPALPDTTAYAPSVEAIRTVNIVTNSYDAEQGLAAGAIINVFTKSGTNAFHGSAWEYNTISALAARNYFTPSTQLKNPKYILNEFGANIGGPILRNHAFFFANWERNRRSQAVSGFQTVPTLAMRSGNFQGTGTTIYDPSTGKADGTGRTPFANNTIPMGQFAFASSQLIPLLPAPNIATTALSNNYFVSASSQYVRDNIDSRVDFNPSSKSTLFGRYGIQKAVITDPQALGAAGGNTLDKGQPGSAPSIVQAVGIGATYTLRSNLLFDGNIGYTRQGLSAVNGDIDQNAGLDLLNIPGTNGSSRLQGGFPAFLITSLSSLGNPNSSNPFQFRDYSYVGSGNLTWQLGRHSMRYGVDYQFFSINHFQPNSTYGARGGFTFSGGVTSLKGGATSNGYNSWADFLLGLPTKLGKDTQFLNPSQARQFVLAGYARDQWQPTTKLTLNYGIRYELYPMANLGKTGPAIYNPDTNNVSIGGVNGVPSNGGVDTGHGYVVPRFGLAYRLDDKTVIRAGYGMSTNPDNFRQVSGSYPSVISESISGANSFQPAGSLATGIPVVPLPDISQGVIPLPANLAAATFAPKYRRGYVESYNLAVQRVLPAGFNFQATYLGSLSVREVVGLNLNAAAPGTGAAGQRFYPRTTATITQYTPMGTGSYNALQMVLKRRFTGGGTVGANYTYSHTIDDYNDLSESGVLINYLPKYNLNRSTAGFDQKHNLEIYSNFMLPAGKGHSFAPGGFFGVLVSGWQLDTVLSRISGTPFTVTSSATSLNAPGNSQFADQLVSRVKILGGHDSTHPYFDPSDFAPVTTARFGTAGRNSVRGPGFFSLNTGLSRTIAIHDRYKFRLKADAFNLTNTPAFGTPASNVSTVTTTGGTTNLNGFGIISTATNQRQLNLSARFSF